MLPPLMAFAQSSIDETIKLNQVGMYPEQEKVAVIENGAQGQSFFIQNSKGKTVYKGKVSRVGVSPWSGKARNSRFLNTTDCRRLHVCYRTALPEVYNQPACA